MTRRSLGSSSVRSEEQKATSNGSGWIPVVAGTPEQLYIVNYFSNGSAVKVGIYRYGLE